MRDGLETGLGHDVLIAKPSSKGGHGFAPTRSALHASLVMSLPDVSKTGNLGVVRMSQIGPTVASWFNATLFAEADRPLTWPDRPGSVH